MTEIQIQFYDNLKHSLDLIFRFSPLILILHPSFLMPPGEPPSWKHWATSLVPTVELGHLPCYIMLCILLLFIFIMFVNRLE